MTMEDAGADDRYSDNFAVEGGLLDERQLEEQNEISREQELEKGIYKAVRDNDVSLLAEMIEDGADIDTVFEDYSGVSTQSLLHICCEKGRLECAKVLLDLGACVNIRDSWGQSPLMCCMITQQLEIAELLLTTDQEIVNHQDRYGKTSLHCAIDSGCVDSVKLLLKFKADDCRHTSDGITSLMLAVTLTDELDSRLEMIKLMLDAGYELEMKDFRTKRTALQMAVVSNNLPAVELLLSRGADINTMDSGWRTPLTNAIFRFARKPPGQDKCEVDPGGLAMIMMLTRMKCDLNMTLIEYCNPLIASAVVDSPKLVEFFLENGSNIDCQFDPTGATPLILTVTRHNLEAFKALLRWNCKLYPIGHIQRRRKDYYFDAFGLSVFLGHLDMVKILAEVGYNLQKVPFLKNPDVDEIPESLQGNPDLFTYLQNLANNPRPLSKECAILIRDSLRFSVEKKVSSLPLPLKLQNFVSMTDILKSLD